MFKQAIIGIIILSTVAIFQSSQSVGQDNSGATISKTGSADNRTSLQVSAVPVVNENQELMLREDDQVMVATTQMFAEECAAVLERWVNTQEISEGKLFSFLYYPKPNTNPPRFTTDYDTLSDRDIQPILEKYLKAQPTVIFATLSDRNGYTPTHNLKYSKKITGDWAKDLLGNRTKRIFADKTGLASARNQKPYLFQTYKRDTGQLMTDLSAPVYVKGRHWGCVRIGYFRTN